MPLDTGRQPRVPSIANKIRTIQGMAKEEMALFLRIANLIDATVEAGRGLANAGDGDNRTPGTGIPIPRNVKAEVVLDGLDISWDPVVIDRLAYYEVYIDEIATFPDPIIRQAFQDKFTEKGLLPLTWNVKVRVITTEGDIGEFSDITSATVVSSVWESDSDVIESVNRTRVDAKPETVGGTFVTPGGDTAVVGIGMATGMQPQFDTSGTFLFASPSSQINATLQQNDAAVDTASNLYGPDAVIESTTTGDVTTTTPFSDTEMANGGVIHFFDADIALAFSTFWDVKMLEFFSSSPHEQLGLVHGATMGTIKF